MDIGALWNLLAQVPLVAAFMWFILEQQKRQQVEQMQRDEQWRNFLRGQREENILALGRLTDKMSCMNAQMAEMNETLTAHDARMKAWWQEKGKPQD